MQRAKQVLIEQTTAGGEAGRDPARRLVEKYPDAALPAIEAGIRATPNDGYRCDYVAAAAGLLPGDAAAAFLKTQLAPGTGLYSQVAAAKALREHSASDALQAMIEAWRMAKPGLSATGLNASDTDDAYNKVGGVIGFLASSGNADAIDALALDLKKTPVDVRLAVVKVFMPVAKAGESAGEFANDLTVSVDADIPAEFSAKASAAMERMLVSELDDTGRRVGMSGNYNEVSYKDPRVCDMAALVLSRRWPEKYHFKWTENAAECDTQIVKLRDLWRAEKAQIDGSADAPPPAPKG